MELHIRDMEFYGGHGVFPEEQLVQGKFVVDVFLQWHPECEFPLDISQTIDYQDVVTLTKEIMRQNEHLLENLAWKIHLSLTTRYPFLSNCRVQVAKWPQVGNKLGKALVIFDGK